ncbi:Phosphate transport system permease protein PstC (TC 3.A.1.7.1) [hydrothermal vent metagenome]|uniref:Phosphate transport system permease protein PstC (TC 3.A.1.7.1) n=1 Tax=hydrothermal vent metagenome TaxID=652676 RepID=A0A3B0RHP5_9ZZZZ
MTQTVTTIDLTGDPKRRRKERCVRAIFLAAGLASIAISALIIVALSGEAWRFISQVDPASLFTVGWFPRRGLYDIPTLIIATLLIAGIGMLLAVPLGLGAAAYLSEYASPGARRRLKPTLEILAGIPSVVLGFWALTFISPEIVQRIFTSAKPFTMMAAGLGVGVLITPLIATVSEDAMRAVPMSLREASYGLGASRATTVRSVVFPASLSGIVASLILALSRAMGETMIVFMAAGAVGGALRTFNPLEPGQTMTAAVASLATGSDQVAGEGLAFQSLFFVGLLLFLITLGLNSISNRIVRKYRNRY